MKDKFGKIHKYCIDYPGKVSFYGFIYVLCLCFYSIMLGIAFKFGDTNQYKGFIDSPNWGPLLIIGIPLILFLASLLFRLLHDAILSLDKILIPINNDDKLFSEKMSTHFGKAWNKYTLPISLLISFMLVLAADYSDIISPLGITEATGEKDWTTMGYIVYSDKPWILFFIFNILAFFAEAIFAYIGIITIFCTAYPLVIFVQNNLYKENTTKANRSFINEYTLKWNYNDAHGRCGLHKLDKVFITYVGIIGMSILMSLISIIKNKYSTGIDDGSLILICSVGLLLPASFLWIIIPYWIKFPTKLPSKENLPKDLQDKDLPDPAPWPLGSEKISWTLLALITGGWVYLLKQGLDYLLIEYFT